MHGLEYSGRPANLEYGWPVYSEIKLAAHKSLPALLAAGRVVEGLATLYGKAHTFNGRVDVFLQGCFGRTLASSKAVRFLIGHDEENLVATTADNLELHTTPAGLAFRLQVPRNEIGDRVIAGIETGEQSAMSVGFRAEHVELKTIKDVEVRFIADASLIEISIGARGVVAGAFAMLASQASQELPLKAAAVSFPLASAAWRVSRSLAGLQEMLRSR
jgi:HK97 family phage prohead protease